MTDSVVDASASKVPRRIVQSLSALVLTAVLVVGGFAFTSTSTSHRAGAAIVHPHAIDAFIIFSMNATGITGEGGTGGPGSIEVSSFQWGVSMGVDPATALASGRVTHNPFSITRKLDKASPQFFKACQQGTRIKQVVVFVTPSKDASSKDTMTIYLNNVTVSKVTWMGGGAGAQPMDSISMVAASYQIAYTPGA